MSESHTEKTVITAEHRFFDLRLKEIRNYRDLIFLYAKRSITVGYKQTILGPLWLIIGPFVTAVIHMIIFGQIAGLSTDHVPQIVFYLFGTSTWGFFSSILMQSSDTFLANGYLFGKVYFPRLAIPISNTLVALFQFAIQFVFGLCFMIYYRIRNGFVFTPLRFLLIPLVLLHLAMLGYGFGILASALTTRYRDLRFLISFGVRLLMYITPIVYPLSQLKTGALRKLALVNPVTAPAECMRWCLWGRSTLPLGNLIYSVLFALVIAGIGTLLFHKVERTFTDTI